MEGTLRGEKKTVRAPIVKRKRRCAADVAFLFLISIHTLEILVLCNVLFAWTFVARSRACGKKRGGPGDTA